jgi:D-tyrosyl-tRNA(Tyr) deacylase
MRVVIQRVTSAKARVAGNVVGSIGPGLLVLVGVADGDSPADVRVMADKLLGLRIFRDDAGKMNRSLVDADGAVLIVSQFTLHADLRRGRRPSFVAAASPEVAEPLVEMLIEEVGEVVLVESGRFGAMMEIDLVNDGPVTIVLDVIDGRVM